MFRSTVWVVKIDGARVLLSPNMYKPQISAKELFSVPIMDKVKVLAEILPTKAATFRPCIPYYVMVWTWF